MFSGALLQTLDKTASVPDISVTTNPGADTSTEVNFVDESDKRGTHYIPLSVSDKDFGPKFGDSFDF